MLTLYQNFLQDLWGGVSFQIAVLSILLNINFYLHHLICMVLSTSFSGKLLQFAVEC